MSKPFARRWPLLLLLPWLAAACIPGGSRATPNTGADVPPELVFCRASATQAAVAEIALRSAQNLGTARVPERNGRELDCRVDPTGTRIAFVRERTPNDPATAELYVAALTGGASERRLTTDAAADAHPCWSPDGRAILFATDRAGDSRLYLADPDGFTQQPFLAAAPGTADGEPDWNAATDRIVFVRREAGGSRLWLVQGDGTGLVPLGPVHAAPTAGIGLREPAFAPDGGSIAVAVQSAPEIARLIAVDVATGAESPLYDPGLGQARLPRYAPNRDRLFFTLAQASAGRAGPRLCALRTGDTEPLLIEPGEQWQVLGIDVLPGMAPAAPPLAAVEVEFQDLEVQISAGIVTQGNKAQLFAADGANLVLATETFEDHEIAGINCKWTLPVAVADDVLALRAHIVASVSRSDADSALRSSLHNPVSGRFDTVTEFAAPGTAPRTLEFATQSLAHVSLERQVRFSVIAELSAGGRAELRVDQVRLEVVRSALPAVR